MGERRRGGQRQDQEGTAGGSSRGAGEGPGGFTSPERPPLQGRARRTSARPGLGSLPGHPPPLAPPAQGRRGSPARAAVCREPRDAAAAAQKPGESTAALATVGISTRRGR